MKASPYGYEHAIIAFKSKTELRNVWQLEAVIWSKSKQILKNMGGA
jgi:hypothetical protein